MTPTVRWTVLLAALLAGCTGDRPAATPVADAPNEENAPGAEVERIAHAYHGLLLDADLKQIEVDVPLIASMQSSLFAVLLPAVDAKVATEIQALMAEADKSGWKAEDRVLADNAILGTLMDRSDQKLQERYDWRYRMVRAQAWELIDMEERPSILEWIRNRGLASFGIPRGGHGAEYVAACKERSVPTPPDFPDPAWTRQGALEGDFSFLGGEVIVYTYWNREGACYALHRLGGNTLGIICQSASTGAGCFYDNVRPGSGRRVDPRRETVVINEVQNGMSLGEDCTFCHRGSNAFIIHPGSVLDVPEFNPTPAVRYSPLGGPSFVNPGPLSLPALTDPDTQGSCEGCHEIPETSPSFCSILQRATERTMPRRDAPVGWTPRNTHPYYAHVDFLRRHCIGG